MSVRTEWRLVAQAALATALIFVAAVSPLIHHGYHQALLLSAGVVAAAAVTAAAIPTRRFS